MKHLLPVFVFAIINFNVLNAQNINGVIISDSANLTVINVWGTHEERGFASGFLLGEQISEMVTGYMLPTFGSYMNAARQIIIDGEDIVIDQEYIDESIAVIEGMNAAGNNYADIDYIDGLVFNAFLDIVKLLGMSSDGPGCSSLMSWGDATLGTDLDGKSVISRHLDWTPHPTLINNQVLVIHVPSEADEQPWAMIGFAGQMSVLSGFNQNLAVFQHMMSDFTAASVQGAGFEPVWLTLRKVVEKLDYNNDGANNTADVMDAINANPMGYADGYIITALARSTEGQDSLIALVAEVAPLEPLLTFRSNSYPDNINGDNLYAANYEIKRNNHNHYCPRYNAVVNSLGDGTGIGQDENWQIMRDYSNSSIGNIQFMQFIPETDVFRISVYREGSPAYMKPPVDFNISELLYYSVGLPALSLNPEVYLYPNPAKNNILFKFHLPRKSDYYRIYSMDGNLVIQGELSKDLTIIDISKLASGIYYYKTNHSGSGKFIKY
jgi:hypothetical protein